MTVGLVLWLLRERSADLQTYMDILLLLVPWQWAAVTTYQWLIRVPPHFHWTCHTEHHIHLWRICSLLTREATFSKFSSLLFMLLRSYDEGIYKEIREIAEKWPLPLPDLAPLQVVREQNFRALEVVYHGNFEPFPAVEALISQQFLLYRPSAYDLRSMKRWCTGTTKTVQFRISFCSKLVNFYSLSQ